MAGAEGAGIDDCPRPHRRLLRNDADTPFETPLPQRRIVVVPVAQLVERGISTAHTQYPSIEWDSRTEDAPKIEQML
ncbi:hypothetical protein ACGFZC_34985 [[Kitasatospora] papulosa]|uniref:hypothetical protein n=1 Tax=[Kitasatospora] papulosa TaxID=1464011 RepID=UPI00371C9995